MACFLYSGYELPNYSTIIIDWDKLKATATESLEEYLKTNRFGFAPDRIDISDPVHHSINQGYKANINCLYFNYESSVKTKKIVTKEKLFKYDFIRSAGLKIPVVKESIANIFQQYCGKKIQIIDVVITLKDGTEITDYKAINVINRVEAFTWEGSKKGMYYEEKYTRFKEYLDRGLDWVPEETRIYLEKEKKARFKKYGNPNINTMDILAFRKEIIDKEIICKDSVTGIGMVMISDKLAVELAKHKYKGLGLFHSSFSSYKFV